MTFKIVTDSTADLPPQLARELGITVVSVYVRFGDNLFPFFFNTSCTPQL